MAEKTAEFETEFTYSPAHGLGPDPQWTRRDPSCVIRTDDTFFVWYTKTDRGHSGYDASVWYATSEDGHHWGEQGEAIPRGEVGAWDEESTFTPDVLVAEGRYYVFYTSVEESFSEQALTAIGGAVADSPHGPWEKLAGNPVIVSGQGNEWDSHRVDDSCLLVRGGKYWLYYKGRQMGLSPRETKMGVAIAESAGGPYVKHPSNPLVSAGHEVLVWPHGEGVGSLCAIGPPSVWYSPDGIEFTMKAEVGDRPSAPGAFRPDAFDDPDFGRGITWGICQHSAQGQRPYLRRFECDLAAAR